MGKGDGNQRIKAAYDREAGPPFVPFTTSHDSEIDTNGILTLVLNSKEEFRVFRRPISCPEPCHTPRCDKNFLDDYDDESINGTMNKAKQDYGAL
ncbi:hypothetical protein Syun_009077 [Stephania yunnanensis]|uniref:Uncharacterized protein n=1 Tax=Stephania yunnanensis TaxID=152371 RepID=A0AAP0KFH9_9MAGN